MMEAVQEKRKKVEQSFSGDIYCDTCEMWIALAGTPAEVLAELREAMKTHVCEDDEDSDPEEYA